MSRLERLTHLALIALCVVSIGLLLEHRFAGGATTAPAAESLIGKSLKVRGADWAASQTHAVLFVNSHCHYCTESAPFYRRLVGALQDGRAAALAVLSTEPVEVTRKFLSDDGVAAKYANCANCGCARGCPASFRGKAR